MGLEIWKDIEGYEGLYQVSNTGKVKSLKRNKLKEFKPGTGGYCYTLLWKNNKQHNKRVNRLVAKAFVPNPDNKPEVNHLDCNKLNNNDWNLEWSTSSENKIHAVKNGLMKGPIISIKQYNKKGQFIKQFESIRVAEKFTKIQNTNISSCAKGKRKSAGGYIWKY